MTGVCNCGNDPNCGTCGGTGTVWIRPAELVGGGR